MFTIFSPVFSVLVFPSQKKTTRINISTDMECVVVFVKAHDILDRPCESLRKFLSSQKLYLLILKLRKCHCQLPFVNEWICMIRAAKWVELGLGPWDGATENTFYFLPFQSFLSFGKNAKFPTPKTNCVKSTAKNMSWLWLKWSTSLCDLIHWVCFKVNGSHCSNAYPHYIPKVYVQCN